MNICLIANAEESIPIISYYKMPIDDYEENLLQDYNGFMDYDDNDAINWNNDDLLVNNSINEFNIIENDAGIIHISLQRMLTESKQKELVTDDMKEHLKYSIELLALLKNKKIEL